MSLQTDAETVRDLADKIVAFEVAKARLIADGNVVHPYDIPDLSITLTAAQKQSAVAVEDIWKQSIKTITAAW